MKKLYTLLPLLVIAIGSLHAQHSVNGKIRFRNASDTVIALTVMVKGGTQGTKTDDQGNFQINVPTLPATLVISSVSFQNTEVIVRSKEAGIILLDPLPIPGEEIVIAADRFPKRLVDAAVSIERISYRQVREAPVLSYNDLALYKKGIDMTTSSLTFKTISTRGFNGSGSTRVNQIVDGMDNQAPGLNFFVGHFAGPTELDVDNMEILPGASSALYGPGGMNGTIIINTKNPFQHQGLEILLREGLSNIDKKQRKSATSFHDFNLRYGKALSGKFAFKIGAQFTSGTDWLANDSTNYLRSGSTGKTIPGNRRSDPNYDGVNVYGDETSINIHDVALAMEQMGYIPVGSSSLIPDGNVSRTGYDEKDVIDPETKNIKFSGALHYKINPRLEAQLMGNWATGNTIYTGNNRFVLKGIMIGQYKLELRSKDWFLRAYTTQEDAGDAYSATVTTQYFNESWKSSQQWYPEYVGNFLGATMNGMTEAEAHAYARSIADAGRPLPGSSQFRKGFDSVRKIPISDGGGLFLEKSQLWMTEGQYDISGIRWAQVIVGGNWKKYVLNSEGTLFTDRPGEPITFHELGAYAQVSRDVLPNRLNLSVSTRYDKNEDFKGRFTPRATALITLAKDHKIRFSWQTAYRFPSTQQKYIMLDVGDYTLLGGLPWIADTMNTKVNPVLDMATMEPFTYHALKPESCRSFELGYKTVINQKLLIDAYVYMARYKDFLGRNVLYQPATGKVYSTVINSTDKVTTHGFGIGFDYSFSKQFNAFMNAYSDVISDVPKGFQPFFNAPKYRMNAGFGSSGFGKKNQFGFNIMMRWQEAFNWDGELANGRIEDFATADVQLSYKFPLIRSVVRIGGTNVLNKYYKTGYGNPEVGGMYYLSLGFQL